MHKYSNPEMEIAKFYVESILTASNTTTINPDAPSDGGWGRSVDSQKAVDLSEV